MKGTLSQFGSLARIVPITILAFGAATAGVPASEAEADLQVHARLLDVAGAPGAGGRLAGMARLEVLVETLLPASKIRIELQKPDGTAWTDRGRPFALARVSWTGPGGEPQEASDGTLTLGRRGTARAVLVVPVEGTAVHELIIVATATGPIGPLRTETMVYVPLGATLPQPITTDGVAEFPAVPSQEVGR